MAKFKDASYHWFHSERASVPAIAQWMGGMWHCIGEYEPITPETMTRRGWEYLGPCTHRPWSEYLDDRSV